MENLFEREIVRRATVKLFAALAVLMFVATPPNSPGQNLPALSAEKLTDFYQIHRRFTNGTVNVIVTLSSPVSPTAADFRSPAALGQLRSQLRNVQQGVLDTLPAAHLKVGFRFDNIAGFSAEVTTNGLQALQAHPGVLTIEPVMELEPHLAQGIPLINGMTYRSTYNGTGLAIAICDTGVDYNHPQLGGAPFPNSKVIGGYDFGDSDADPIPNTQAHGTCCAGIAAGDLPPVPVGDYIGGVAYNAKIYAVKISSGTTGSATTAAMVAAWDWCVTHQNDNPSYPIMVISTSFGGGQYFSACDGITPSMTTAANNAVAAGITVLASSGNDGYCDSMGWPACISSVISVGAVYDANFGHYYPCVNSASCAAKISTTGCSTHWYVDDATAADKVTSYANVASFLTLFAPANDCYTLDISGSSGYSSGDYYPNFGGTSAACPYAAGAVACLQSAAKALTGSYLTPADVKSRLITYGDSVTDTKVAITKPRVNLANTIAALTPVIVPVIVSAGTTLTSESCSPTNGAVDPGETVTVSVALKNIGTGNTTDLIVTLLAANGVTAPSAPQNYGTVVAGGSAVTQTFSFTATGDCGGTITPVFQLQNDATNLGTISQSLPLGVVAVLTTSITNATSITIPASGTSGNASLYPSAISISDITGTLSKVTVTLNGLTHTYPDDLDILLVGPGGQNVLLMSDCGGSANLNGMTLTFDDAATASLPDASQISPGTYKPTDFDTTSDVFLLPAPSAPFGSTLSVFNGLNPNGNWSLYIRDDSTHGGQSNVGSLAQGWTLSVTTSNLSCCVGPPPATVAGRMVFYNRSAWDGNDAGANASDDNAVAPDKTALLPGGTATFAHYTSYSRGLNGIMVDIAGLAGTPTVGDFGFKSGNDNTPAGWAAAPVPVSVTVRAGAGIGGSDRVTLIWNDNNLDGVMDANEAVAKRWLQVTVKARANTGLAADDVFYFGNAPGEAGDTTANAIVNPADELLARANPRNFLNPAPLDFPYDYNRDQRVDPADQLIARANQNNFLSALKLITVPAGTAGGSALASVASLASEVDFACRLTVRWVHPGMLRVEYEAGPGQTGTLQRNSDLHSAAWEEVSATPDVSADGTRQTWLLAVPPGSSAGFYRIVLHPLSP